MVSEAASKSEGGSIDSLDQALRESVDVLRVKRVCRLIKGKDATILPEGVRER